MADGERIGRAAVTGNRKKGRKGAPERRAVLIAEMRIGENGLLKR